jgi:hypothetical protein
MGKYIIRRLLQMIPVIIGVTFIIFVAVYALGDPTAGRCGERACPEAYIAKFRAEHNLDQPLIIQYALYMGNLVQGDLGTNFFGNSVAEELLARWPVSLKLALMALCFEIIIGITAGVLAGIRRGHFVDSPRCVLNSKSWRQRSPIRLSMPILLGPARWAGATRNCYPSSRRWTSTTGSQMILRQRRRWRTRMPRWRRRLPSWRRDWSRLPSGSRDCSLPATPTTPRMR